MTTVNSSASSGSAAKDPKMSEIGDVTTPVEVGHILTVSLEFLYKAPVDIRWQQSSKERSDIYYQVAYTNTTNAKYYLFISSGKLDEFRKLDTANGAGGKVTFNVTKDFQYGQKDRVGSNRFLVYHESNRVVMRQGRFIAAAWAKYGNMAGGSIDNLQGGFNATKIFDIMNRMGDSLHRFGAAK